MTERIKAIRTALGLSQEAFANGLNVTRGVVANIEYGKAPVKDYIVKLICDNFNVRREYLIGGELPMFRECAMADKIAGTAAAAAQTDPEAAKRFFENMYKDLGEANVLLLYQVFRTICPQYDKPEEPQK